MNTHSNSKSQNRPEVEIGIDSGLEGILGIARIGPVYLLVVVPPTFDKPTAFVTNRRTKVSARYNSDEETVSYFVHSMAGVYRGPQEAKELHSKLSALDEALRQAGIAVITPQVWRAFLEAVL